MKIVDVPNTQAQLLARVHAIAGMTVGQSACQYQLDVPNDLRHHKGWFGHLIEKVLGASAGSKPIPDFPNLGLETSNGVEVSGLNAEEQSDIALIMNWTKGQAQTNVIEVFTYTDRMIILYENNALTLVQ